MRQKRLFLNIKTTTLPNFKSLILMSSLQALKQALYGNYFGFKLSVSKKCLYNTGLTFRLPCLESVFGLDDPRVSLLIQNVLRLYDSSLFSEIDFRILQSWVVFFFITWNKYNPTADFNIQNIRGVDIYVQFFQI